MSFNAIDFEVNFAHTKRYSKHQVQSILEDSSKQGIDKVLSISNNMNEARTNWQYAKEFEHLHFTAGVHPHNAKQFKVSDIAVIENMLADPKCFGVGECGLDYNRMFSSRDEQIFAFRSQVELAKKHNAKLYLHCRDAYEDFLAILKEYDYFHGIVHCFTGNTAQALELTSLGFRLGVTGWLLDNRRNADLVAAVKQIPLDLLLVETDAPFMSIASTKRKHSVPVDTKLVAERIAILKGLDVIETGNTLHQNALDFLGGAREN